MIEGSGGGRILVDAGPDLREQFLANGVRAVDALLLTHAHSDHIAGVDELRAVNRITGAALPAYGTGTTLAALTNRFDYAFRPVARGFPRPALTATEVAVGQTVEMAGMEVRLFRQDHRVMETLGLRVGPFGYSTDLVGLSDDGFAALAGIETWVVGCFARTPHPVHAHVELVAEWAARLRPRRTVLTHMGSDLDWAWMAANLPPGLEAAFDGMVLAIG